MSSRRVAPCIRQGSVRGEAIQGYLDHLVVGEARWFRSWPILGCERLKVVDFEESDVACERQRLVLEETILKSAVPWFWVKMPKGQGMKRITWGCCVPGSRLGRDHLC